MKFCSLWPLLLAIHAAAESQMFSDCVPSAVLSSTLMGATHVYSVLAGEMCQIEFPYGPLPMTVDQTNVSISFDPTSHLMVIQYRCPPQGSCYNKVLQSASSFTLE